MFSGTVLVVEVVVVDVLDVVVSNVVVVVIDVVVVVLVVDVVSTVVVVLDVEVLVVLTKISLIIFTTGFKMNLFLPVSLIESAASKSRVNVVIFPDSMLNGFIQ